MGTGEGREVRVERGPRRDDRLGGMTTRKDEGG